MSRRAMADLGHEDEVVQLSEACASASANRHEPAFHPDQTWRTHTCPKACLRAVSEIREPPHPRLQDKDKAQMDFGPARAIPRRHLSDGDIPRCRSTACGRCRALPQPAFRHPGAQSQADCRSARTRRGHCTAGWRPEVQRGSRCSLVYSNMEGAMRLISSRSLFAILNLFYRRMLALKREAFRPPRTGN